MLWRCGGPYYRSLLRDSSWAAHCGVGCWRHPTGCWTSPRRYPCHSKRAGGKQNRGLKLNHKIPGAHFNICSGIILYMPPANERRCDNATSSPIGWVHTQNDPCMLRRLIVRSYKIGYCWSTARIIALETVRVVKFSQVSLANKMGLYTRMSQFSQVSGTAHWPNYDDVIKWKHIPCCWPFVREFTGHRWIPLTMASDPELWCILWSVPE